MKGLNNKQLDNLLKKCKSIAFGNNRAILLDNNDKAIHIHCTWGEYDKIERRFYDIHTESLGNELVSMFARGMSYKEIAEETGLPMNKLYQYKHYYKNQGLI